ncbi:plasmid maintenance protein CcdB [Roseococcus sp. SYP-B2431]|uniref:CcdB family protein n=1 Tax=Roseococcus sp. SYP-B2431 TaxID=2496640 RepID=UPI00103E2560|nr:CcdB family protein [Roseococcus sp. SYP-B2431]TCH97426.1 plasmid maintenance protein CcdB [Roseococcus sp. SYP-B2431]
MARFDLFRRARGAPGYLLQVQSEFLDALETRVVAPLLPPAALPLPVRDLHPRFEIEGEPFLMATQLLGAIPRRELGRPVGSLADRQEEITRALDTLLTGF